MKPYDQVFLYDAYNDMAGPIEVEQVTHISSQETGFVTVITPDLAEGDLSPKRLEISRSHPKSGLFSVNFYFIIPRLHYLFLAEIRGFLGYIKILPILLSA
jgi:hypothetical protein